MIWRRLSHHRHGPLLTKLKSFVITQEASFSFKVVKFDQPSKKTGSSMSIFQIAMPATNGIVMFKRNLA